MYTTVTGGILDVTNVSSSESLNGGTALSFSFTAQTAAIAALGSIQVQDARGTNGGWGVDLSATDWKSGEDVPQLDYNGTGSRCGASHGGHLLKEKNISILGLT